MVEGVVAELCAGAAGARLELDLRNAALEAAAFEARVRIQEAVRRAEEEVALASLNLMFWIKKNTSLV
jgi:hypothetical protein